VTIHKIFNGFERPLLFNYFELFENKLYESGRRINTGTSLSAQ
jgi:hypothetical protein